MVILMGRNPLKSTERFPSTAGWRSVAQSCLTLCEPKNQSPPGSPVHEISQAGILEWIAIPFSRGSSQPRAWTCVSCVGRWLLYHWVTWEDPVAGYTVACYFESFGPSLSNSAVKSCEPQGTGWMSACKQEKVGFELSSGNEHDLVCGRKRRVHSHRWGAATERWKCIESKNLSEKRPSCANARVGIQGDEKEGVTWHVVETLPQRFSVPGGTSLSIVKMLPFFPLTHLGKIKLNSQFIMNPYAFYFNNTN